MRPYHGVIAEQLKDCKSFGLLAFFHGLWINYEKKMRIIHALFIQALAWQADLPPETKLE